MNRYDPDAPRQQGGSYSGTHGSYDSARQANQWQGDPGGQAGGDWGHDDGQPTRLQQDDRLRARDRIGETRDFDEGRGYGALDREYRSDPRSGRQRPERSYRSGYADRYYDAGYRTDFSPFTSEDYGGHDLYARSGATGGGFRPSDTYRPSYGLSRGNRDSADDYSGWREYGEHRGFFDRAGDEIASWFGDEDAARRREQDHRGRGPSDYTRSDERIREDVNDHLTHDWRVDASHVRVTVQNGEVTLDGTVDTRSAKRRAEDVADSVSGVRHVQNNLRVEDAALKSATAASRQAAATKAG